MGQERIHKHRVQYTVLILPGILPGGESGATTGGTATSNPKLMMRPELRDLLVKTIKEECLKYGGPTQFLEHRYPTEESKHEYAMKLWHQFPPDDTIEYQRFKTVPAVCENENLSKPMYVHIAMISFDGDSSPKEPTTVPTAESSRMRS